MSETVNHLDRLVEAFGQLSIMQDEDNDRKAAALYRAMFVNDYGTYLIKNLSKQLLPEFGSGFGVRQLERARAFYQLYPIASTLRTQLNWSQYKLLIGIADPDKREYYELK